MPADTADFHSQVLWWRGRHHTGEFLDGGLHFWKPGTDSPTDPWTTSFTSSRPIPIPADVDVFCASHDQLPGEGGRILVTGGTEKRGGETGTSAVRIFNSVARAWEASIPDSMSARRWYPTATTLGDGRVFVSSGSSHFNFHLYGGLRTNETFPPSDRQLHRYQIIAPGGRDPAVQPPPSPAEWPLALEGHSATYQQIHDAAIYFGGIASGTGAASDATWRLVREESDLASDYVYTFTRQTPVASPPARSQHSAVVADKTMLMVWGGRTVSSVLSDPIVWIYDVPPGGSILNWRQVSASGGPSARYGHGAFFDPGHNRMLIFGGSTSVNTGALADTVVWAFNFDATRENGTWSQPQIVDALEDGNPPALAEFGMVEDPVARRTECSTSAPEVWNAILFGGRRGPYSAPNYSNELWILWSWPSGPNAGKLEWQKVTASGAPAARSRPGLGYDASTGRLFVMGGRNASGKLGDVTRINVHPEMGHEGCDAIEWASMDTLAARVEGHSVQIATRASFSRTPEVYGQGSWTSLTAAKRLQNWYPFQFLRPYPGLQIGQRIFTAGPDDTSQTTIVIDGSSLVGPTATSSTPLIGGSAVMYAPGQIMKCGTRDAPDDAGGIGGPATARTQTINADSTSLIWFERNPMTLGRVNHNLTLLPSGEVLAAGGTERYDNGNALDPVYEPQIWNPSNYTWGPLLEASTVIRDYHNTALLMPDARVLAGGGNICEDDPYCTNDRKLDVFSPPYLYSGNDQRPRRTILGGDGVLVLDDVFTVLTDSVAMDTIVLIRAGMVTHGFDSGQRIIRPVKQECSECASQSPPRSKFKLPVGDPYVDPREVPPGFYQLFAIRHGVPSMSRWVRVLLQGEPATGRSDVGDRWQPSKVLIQSSASPCDEDFPLITWTAPAEDSTLFGVAKEYDLREAPSLCSGCWTPFQTANEVDGEPEPESVGTPQSMHVAGLSEGYSYKFQMVTKDDRVGRSSALSNVLTVHVLGCDEGMSGGGGGGGGSSARGETIAAAKSSAEGQPVDPHEVSVRAASLESTTTELLPLALGPRFLGDRVQAYLRRGASGFSQVSGVQLVAVDGIAGEPLLASDGRAVAGTRVSALSAERESGGSALEELASDDNPFVGRPGDVLLVRLPRADGATPLVIRALGVRSPGIEDYGIAIEVPDGSGWREAGRVVPRRQFTDLVVEGVPGEVVRLSFKHPHAVSRIERLLPVSQAPTVHRPAFAAAGHSRLGVLESSAFVVDGGVVVAARETVTVDFARLPDPAEGVTRTWYLEVTGRHEEPQRAAQFARSTPTPLVTTFAFHAARPNPSSGRTSFDFATPTACRAQLEVFDLLGRRVAKPYDTTIEAGRHTIEWNGADENGGRVHAGLYVCRLQAGAFRGERKLLIVP